MLRQERELIYLPVRRSSLPDLDHSPLRLFPIMTKSSYYAGHCGNHFSSRLNLIPITSL